MKSRAKRASRCWYNHWNRCTPAADEETQIQNWQLRPEAPSGIAISGLAVEQGCLCCLENPREDFPREERVRLCWDIWDLRDRSSKSMLIIVFKIEQRWHLRLVPLSDFGEILALTVYQSCLGGPQKRNQRKESVSWCKFFPLQAYARPNNRKKTVHQYFFKYKSSWIFADSGWVLYRWLHLVEPEMFEHGIDQGYALVAWPMTSQTKSRYLLT